MKRTKLILAFFLIGTVCLFAAGITASAQQRAISEKMIRLHVIANSDSAPDQALKLKVRDAILAYLNTQNFTSREDAIEKLSSQLQEISNQCMLVVEENGADYAVSAELGYEHYPTRDYGSFSLPSGEYLSLQIKLGDAAGANWWCVVYPAICMPSGCEEFSAAVTTAGLSGREVTFITADTPEIQMKFKILEVFDAVHKFLQDT